MATAVQDGPGVRDRGPDPGCMPTGCTKRGRFERLTTKAPGSAGKYLLFLLKRGLLERLDCHLVEAEGPGGEGHANAFLLEARQDALA